MLTFLGVQGRHSLQLRLQYYSKKYFTEISTCKHTPASSQSQASLYKQLPQIGKSGHQFDSRSS